MVPYYFRIIASSLHGDLSSVWLWILSETLNRECGNQVLAKKKTNSSNNKSHRNNTRPTTNNC